MKGLSVNKSRPESTRITIKNVGTSTIAAGSPVCFVMNGTDDGLSVDVPSVVGANSFSFLAGVALSALQPGQFGEAQVFGFSPVVRILRTRANSTTPFASLPLGLVLNLNTANNAFESSASGTATHFPYQVVLAQSFASIATSTASTQTATVQTGRVFLRVM